MSIQGMTTVTEDHAIELAKRERDRLLEDVWTVTREEVDLKPWGAPKVLASAFNASEAQVRVGLLPISGREFFGLIYRVTLGFNGQVTSGSIASATMIETGQTVSGHRSTPTVSVTPGDRSLDLAGYVDDAGSTIALRFQMALGFQLIQRVR